MPTPEDTPFARVGGAEAVRALAEEFYEEMFRSEPALARLHECDADGRVTKTRRDRFALFLVGWLGGPQDYMQQHGHPRLRMRHGTVPINTEMRDAWVRCMSAAMKTRGLGPEIRAWLEPRFQVVAEFLRNVPDGPAVSP